MSGMGSSLQTNNPTVIAAFESALVHQGLVVLVVLALLAVAWNLLRRVQLRQAAAGSGQPVSVLAGQPGSPEPMALHLLRISFGCIWIFDGILQAQVSMPLGMASGVMQPAASGSPSWVVHLVNFAVKIWNDHPVPAAASAVWIQVGIGILLLVAPRGNWLRLAGAASVAWGLVVWVFGEAFGAIFTPGLTWLFGAPGGVIFYVIAGALIALPERYWARPRLGRMILAVIGLFFVGMAVLQAWPGRGYWQGQPNPHAVAGTLTGMVQSMAQTPQPGLLSSWVASFAAFDASHGWAVNLFAVIALATIGLAFLVGRPRLVFFAVVAGALLCLADWVLIEDLGFLGGVGTDPNSMVPMLLIFVAGYLAMTRLPATASEPVPEIASSESALSWWGRFASRPAYALRSLAAIGAIGVVLLGAAPMVAASTNSVGDPLLTEAINGNPAFTNVAAVPFKLVDQDGSSVSLGDLRGKVVALTFLDPVCTTDCPLIAQEFAEADQMLGALASRGVRGNRGQPDLSLRCRDGCVHSHRGARPCEELAVPHRIAQCTQARLERLRHCGGRRARGGHGRPQRDRVPHRPEGSGTGHLKFRSRRRDRADEILFRGTRRGRATTSPDGVMSRPVLRKSRLFRRATRAFMLGALVALLAACSSADNAPATTAKLSSPAEVQVPLDGSLVTADATWAVVEMGHLDQLANTFWQLFVLHRGDSRWSLVTPPGFADNGGLVATSAKGTSLVTGFQANQLNHFSPVAASSDGGKTWAPGVLGQGIADVPDAMAASITGKVLALVGRPASSVLWSVGNLSDWQTLASEKSIASSPISRGCAVTSITAVSFVSGGQPIVGATCSHAGNVGIFEYADGTWRSFAPRLLTSISHATTQVLRLTSSSGIVSAIIAARTGSHTVLFAARLFPGQSHWAVSGALNVPKSAQVLSSGTSSGGGVFVALSSGTSESVEVEATFNGSWTQLPVVPKGTETVAFSENGRVDALVSSGSVLTDYTLDVSQRRWRQSQVVKVPIQYGSSN